MGDTATQVTDSIQPVSSRSGGVYTLRSREPTGVGSISSARRGKDDHDLESSNVEERDFKTKQVFQSHLSHCHLYISLT